jgi:hypothetical protein
VSAPEFVSRRGECSALLLVLPDRAARRRWEVDEEASVNPCRNRAETETEAGPRCSLHADPRRAIFEFHLGRSESA